ncbi:MAG: hypothetical protein F4114_04535 [Rhodospirillaceae bacterium]|nr:hypothetical protein [Rhodospirillaceae bacterium]MYB14292.1 hypothetical protein [Rhodospirillaceae bacterium]MYI48340.1 hypothetical protein [Rhodospirillaceae bacterium]
MKPMLQSVFATGALALFLTMPAAPLQAGPGAPARTAGAGAAWSHAGPEAILVHDRRGPRYDRWRPRHDRWRGRHGYPPRWRHRHRPYPHRSYPHRATPYWSFTYPLACFAATPWPRGHWRNHRHRHVRGHRHRVPRHRHIRCHGGVTVVLPLSHPPRRYR